MSPARTIEAFAVERVKDHEILARPPGCPIPAEILRQLLENCPVVLVDPAVVEDSLPFNDANSDVFGVALDVELSQISSSHQRSFNVSNGYFSLPWQDEYNNCYGGFSLKGNNFSKPGILKHPTASEGYIAYGLQESSIIERVLKTSELLRSYNIATEYIVGVSELKAYPWPTIDGQTDASELVSLKEYKRRVISSYWKELPDTKRTAEALGELYSKFKEMTFYVSLRATDTPYRLGDIEMATNRDKFFTYVNEHLLANGERPFDPDSYDDGRRYLIDHFSPEIGRNLARLHNAGLGHKFTHKMNLTALGGIVDLDSVYGERLGFDDEPLTSSGRCIDIVGVLESLNVFMGLRSVINPDHSAAQAFLDTYYAESMQLSSHASVVSELMVTFAQVADWIEQHESTLPYWGETDSFSATIIRRFDLPTTTDFEVNDSTNLELILQVFTAEATAVDFQSMDALISSIEDAFVAGIDVFALLINEEVIDEVNVADTEQIPFSAYDTFMTMPSRHSSEAYSELRTIVQKECGASLEVMLRAKLDTNELGVQFSSHSGLANCTRTRVSELVEVMRPKMDEITDNLFVRHHAKLRQSADFYKPPSVMGGITEDSWLHDPVQDSRFWRLSENVTFENVAQYLAKTNANVPSHPLEISGSNRTNIFIHKGINLREIIIDSNFGSLSHSIDTEGVTIEIDHEEPPTYVLVVEEASNGTLEYTLYTARSLGELKAASGTALSEYSQLALF